MGLGWVGLPACAKIGLGALLPWTLILTSMIHTRISASSLSIVLLYILCSGVRIIKDLLPTTQEEAVTADDSKDA